MNRTARAAFALAMLGCLPAAASIAQAQTAAQPLRVRGTVQSLQGSTLVVKPRSGDAVSIVLDENWSVSGVAPFPRENIKSGDFIGTTAVPHEGDTMRALEIHVFPEEMRGLGEGTRPWDLAPDSSMINATIEADVLATDGRTLTLAWQGGKARIVVKPDTPVVTFVPAAREDVTPGAGVITVAQRGPDGALHASRVQVGKGGIAPPM